MERRRTPSTGGIRLSRRRKRSVARFCSFSPRPSVDVSGAGRLERAGCGRLGLQWKPRARLAAGTGVRGSRSVGRGARGCRLGHRVRRGGGGCCFFGLGVWRPFPRGKRLFSHTSFPTSFPGQSNPVPRPFPVIFGSPQRHNPKKAHHNRAVSKDPGLGDKVMGESPFGWRTRHL